MHRSLSHRTPADTPQAFQRHPEDAALTHDGVIWPVARGSMREPSLILRRMALDMRHLPRETGEDCVRDTDLTNLGWSVRQLISYSDEAAKIAKALEADNA